MLQQPNPVKQHLKHQPQNYPNDYTKYQSGRYSISRVTINDEKLSAVEESPTTLYIERDRSQPVETALETILPDEIPDWETIPDEEPVQEREVTRMETRLSSVTPLPLTSQRKRAR